MKSTVLWVVGAPGAGKTSFVRSLLGTPVSVQQKPKWTRFQAGAWAAGWYTGQTFDGADTVPYNGVAAALEFWRERLAAEAVLTVFDGDRFSDRRAFDFFFGEPGGGRSRCACVLLTLSEADAAARREQRGSTQNPTWVKGRVTKARRFFECFPSADRLELDALKPPGELALSVSSWLEETVGE